VIHKPHKTVLPFIGIHQKSLPESAKQMPPLNSDLESSQQTNALLTSPFFGPADLVHHTNFLPILYSRFKINIHLYKTHAVHRIFLTDYSNQPSKLDLLLLIGI